MAQPGDDRPADDGDDDTPVSGDDATRLDAPRIVIPNDARELDPDVAAYHREVRALHRRELTSRVLMTRRWQRYGISGPIVVGVLIVVAAIASLLVAVRPNPAQPRPAQDELATVAGPTGSIGGLVSDVTLTVGGTPTSVRNLRPALVVLVPTACDCATTLDNLAGQAAQWDSLRMWVVAPSATDPQIEDAVSATRHGNVAAAYDRNGDLAKQYSAHGVTAVLVHQDGVVVGVVPDLGPDSRLDSMAVRGLTQPRA